MRLDNLYSRSKVKLLSETDLGTALEPGRYPSIRKHTVAKYKPTIDVEQEVETLKRMAFEYPKGKEPEDLEKAIRALRRSQKAFNMLLQKLQLNPMSGLKGENEYARLSEYAQKSAAQKDKFGHPGPSAYIVIAADVDDMKYLNDKSGLGHRGVNAILQNIGQLFTENFQIEDTKLFHPHGDEFRVISHIGKLSQEQARLKFARLIQGCLAVSNNLASTGFYMESWPSEKRVQPTISFGMSTTDSSADGLLTHVKTGASDRKPMKYSLVIDRDLRYDLGLNPQEMNKYVASLKQALPKGDAEILTLDPPEMVVHEDKSPMDGVRKKQGIVVLESSWSEIPPQRRKELDAVRKQKRSYLNSPGGVMKVGKHYLPLKESYKE